MSLRNTIGSADFETTDFAFPQDAVAGLCADAEYFAHLLNELRAERIEGYTAQTYPGLLAEIIKERRCELVWEGHRLFDARRLKVTMTREGKTISADDYRLTLPIPQAEIDANSGISESDQNYGY